MVRVLALCQQHLPVLAIGAVQVDGVQHAVGRAERGVHQQRIAVNLPARVGVGADQQRGLDQLAAAEPAVEIDDPQVVAGGAGVATDDHPARVAADDRERAHFVPRWRTRIGS